MLVLIWLVVLAAATYLYVKQSYTRFSNSDVKCSEITPLLGTVSKYIMRKEHMVDLITRLYNRFRDEKFYGQYLFLSPVVVIKDIELVKQITIKDFDSFGDHKIVIDDTADPIIGRSLISLKGQQWRDMRSALSPAFTSSKIKSMVPLMVEVSNQLVETLRKSIKDSNGKFIDIEAKDLTTRYANDVIASCAFGLKINSLADDNNIFFKMGKEVTAPTMTIFMMFKMFMFMCLPKISKILAIPYFPKATADFFRGIILDTMRDRETRNIFRPDMIQLLLDAKKGQLTHEDKPSKDLDAGFATVEESTVGTKTDKHEWSDGDLVAQAVIFLLAGFETVSTVMSFALHELAVNPDVQEKLLAEIQQNEVKNGGKFDYNSIQHMVYMDMVVCEVLRMWPPAPTLDRLCTKDYNLGKPNIYSNKDFYIRKGENVSIPIWAIHRNPEYFENASKFDPERFSDENKQKILPFTYIPFGAGPRNCIGSRFALCEVKVMLYQLLQHFELSPCEKTCIPVELEMKAFNIKIKGGHWVRMKSRN